MKLLTLIVMLVVYSSSDAMALDKTKYKKCTVKVVHVNGQVVIVKRCFSNIAIFWNNVNNNQALYEMK